MTEAPLWVALESVDCDPLSTANLFWLTPTQRWTINYPITKPSLSIWDRLKAWFLVHNLDTIPFFPFSITHHFYRAWSSPTSFIAWLEAGLTCACHFYKSTTITPFLTLRETYDLPPSETFKYFQTKNFLMNNAPSDSTSPGFTIFGQACKSDPHRRGLTSNLYAQLLSQISSSPPTYTNEWESDLQLQPEDINWTQIWQATNSASQNIVTLETNYKVLTRWYLVPASFRGCPTLGTRVHIWWECKIARSF